MAIPNAEEARRILAARRLPNGVVAHSEGVARVAVAAARLVEAALIPVDVGLVEVAAVLHDIDKPLTRGRGERHGEVGARLLREMGFGALAPPIASHTIEAVLDERWFPRGWPSVLLWVADKHVAQSFMTIDERLDDMAQRYPRYRADIEAARPWAHRLEREVAEGTGLAVSDLVERLRSAWEAGAPPAGGAAHEEVARGGGNSSNRP
jgi:putative nucleotidyltransferase with HDIG domain